MLLDAISIVNCLDYNGDKVDSNVYLVSFQTNVIFLNEMDEDFEITSVVSDHATNKRNYPVGTTVVHLVSWYSYHITFDCYYDYPSTNVQGIYQQLDEVSYFIAITVKDFVYLNYINLIYLTNISNDHYYGVY